MIAVGVVGLMGLVGMMEIVGFVGMVGLVGMMGMVGIVGFVRMVAQIIDLNSQWHKHQHHTYQVLRHHKDLVHVSNHIFHLLVTLPALTQNSICKEHNT